MPEGTFLLEYGPYILALILGYIVGRIGLSLRISRDVRLLNSLNGPATPPGGDGGLPLPLTLAPEKAEDVASPQKRKPRAAPSGRGRYKRTVAVRRRMSIAQTKRWRRARSGHRATGKEKAVRRA